MVRGHNFATCLHCGREWVVGDCIPSTCAECYAAGHRSLPISGACPVCEAVYQRLLRRVEEARERAEYERLRAKQGGGPCA